MLGPILARFNLSSSSKVKLSESIMVSRRFTFCNNSLYLLLGMQTVESIILLILSLMNIKSYLSHLNPPHYHVQVGCTHSAAPTATFPHASLYYLRPLRCPEQLKPQNSQITQTCAPTSQSHAPHEHRPGGVWQTELLLHKVPQTHARCPARGSNKPKQASPRFPAGCRSLKPRASRRRLKRVCKGITILIIAY